MMKSFSNQKTSENIGDCIVEFNRILTPVGSVDELSKWLKKMKYLVYSVQAQEEMCHNQSHG